ncbi:translation initiation factor IF-2-like [Strigops habroptila]|uniref:translation initiation factor IF-2-like n=1 Tax=Strigops habroptila TaxID=2489341 RepID=UPI0011CFB401|nr:translation initiation factor IF-2-like [Strigops habroptila]
MEEGGRGLLQAPPPPSPGPSSAERAGWGAAEDHGLLASSAGAGACACVCACVYVCGAVVALDQAFPRHENELQEGERMKGARLGGGGSRTLEGNQRCCNCKRQLSCRGGGRPGGFRRGAAGSRPGRPAPPAAHRRLLPPSLSFLPVPVPSRGSSLAASPGASSLPPATQAKLKSSGEQTRHRSHPSTAERARRRRAAPAEGSAADRYLPAPGAGDRKPLEPSCLGQSPEDVVMGWDLASAISSFCCLVCNEFWSHHLNLPKRRRKKERNDCSANFRRIMKLSSLRRILGSFILPSTAHIYIICLGAEMN